jgi:hypothetical protein
MRILLKFAAAIAVFLFLTKTNVNAQGCVAIRSTGGLMQHG